MSKGKLAIVGIGEVPTGIYPERTPWDILYEVCREAVMDAGLDKNDIEGVISVNPMGQPRLASEIGFGKIPEELGLNGCNDVCICLAGGATTTNCFRLAEQWIHSGLAKIVLIPHTTVHSILPPEDLINFFATAGMDLQWEHPFGTTYNGIMGMLTQRYMHDSGTTAEEMASIVVSLRKWAALDPMSMFYQKEVPSIEKVLSSKMVTTPLHKRECNMLADGGSAMVVTSAELAGEITKTPVYKLGEAVQYLAASGLLRASDAFITAPRDTLEQVLAQAGITKDDIDIWNVYAAYPVLHPMIMEGLGLCEPGGAGKVFMEGRTWPGGDLPWATMGDAMGRGHTGSGVSNAYYVDTARQLMGKAGDRQIPNAKYAYNNTSGGSGMNFIASVWGREIP